VSRAPHPTLYQQLAAAVRAARPVALVTVVDGPRTGAKLLVFGDVRRSTRRATAEPPAVAGEAGAGEPPAAAGGAGAEDDDVVGDLGGSAELARRAAWEGRGALARGGTRLVHDCADHTLFVEAFVPPPRMVVFGAIDFSAALVRVAQVLGFRVTVCDARPVFATRLRFPTADEVVVDWPDRLLARIGPALGPRDAVCVLTHDAKFDVPAVLAALATDVGYIGALGSRRTHAERLLRLEEAGVDGDALVRLRSPIGLDLGARTPEETAVAICAEIIADQTGSRPAPLSETDGPIHRRPFAGGRAESGADAETGRSTGTAVGGA
jgi:xanthine dehydrogenase accessory factor